MFLLNGNGTRANGNGTRGSGARLERSGCVVMSGRVLGGDVKNELVKRVRCWFLSHPGAPRPPRISGLFPEILGGLGAPSLSKLLLESFRHSRVPFPRKLLRLTAMLIPYILPVWTIGLHLSLRAGLSDPRRRDDGGYFRLPGGPSGAAGVAGLRGSDGQQSVGQLHLSAQRGIHYHVHQLLAEAGGGGIGDVHDGRSEEGGGRRGRGRKKGEGNVPVWRMMFVLAWRAAFWTLMREEQKIHVQFRPKPKVVLPPQVLLVLDVL